MKNVVVIYSSLHASSIASAAIAAIAAKGNVVCLDSELKDNSKEIESLLSSDNNDVETYLMCELAYSEDSNIKVVESLDRGDDNYRKRMVLVWEEFFPGLSRPLAIHYLGGYQLSENDVVKQRYLSLAVESNMMNLDGHGIASWKNLIFGANKNALLNGLLEEGKAIQKYLEATGMDNSEESDTVKEVMDQNEALSDENSKLSLEMGELEKTLSEKDVEISKLESELAWWKSKVSDGHLIYNCTPEEVKERFKVKDLKEFCKNNSFSGYSKMNEDQLIAFIHEQLGKK